MTAAPDDYRWLTTDAAQHWLSKLAGTRPDVATVRSLRESLTPVRTHLLLEQVGLRERAALKFSRAAEMLFTDQSLQQATDERIASLKAARFGSATVTDICCGIGGDLLGLGRRGPAIGIDRNPTVALLADWNCRALDVDTATVQVGEATGLLDTAGESWHADPDRRAASVRTAQAAWSEPPADTLRAMLAHCPNAAIKLAPAADDQPFADLAPERQWIGSRGECRQQVLWFGDLARHAGLRTVVVAEAPDRWLVERPEIIAPDPCRVELYLFEPHAAVLASSLQSTLAAECGLRQVVGGGRWLTADQAAADPLWTCFEVLATMPYDVKKLRGALKERRVGRLEVKNSAVGDSPERIRRLLKPRGDGAATVIIHRTVDGVQAVIARRTV